jgi:7,8-dihydropterin-6-yl-methyl-4-(beta-D-ribofuranosyl)aminobenzene 5'-phosphate synthase
MNRIQITILVEDRSSLPELRAEHGISLVLDIDGMQWLFDTGQSSLVVDNARSLGIDLKKIKGIILSHGHYDHTGGLKSVLDETGDVAIYAHPGIFRERFRREKSGKFSPIGIPFSRHLLEESGARFNLAVSGREISSGIYISGEIPRITSFEQGDPLLVVKEGDQSIPDPFLDDQFILIDDDDGVIMITGCCHSGLINSLKKVRELHPRKRIKAIVGGLHLRAADQTKLEKIIRLLEPFAPEEIIAGHCTGEGAEAALSHAFGSRFRKMETGTVFEF